MKCKKCEKNDAKIHFAKIINDSSMEFHLCEPCAHEMGVIGPNHDFHLENLLAGLATEKDITEELTEDDVASGITCSNCKMTVTMFKQTGRLGCSKCYEAFHDELIPLLRKIHGSANHTGKIPEQLGGDETRSKARDIKKLRRELRDAITKEDYEEAAALRDKIREMESALNKMGAS